MIEAYKKFWVNYFNFSDRSTVGDYWWVALCNFIIGFVLGFISGIVPALSFLSIVYTLASLIPGLSLAVRRLHDTNKSGWYYLFILIPLVGAILLIVWFCGKSVDENNNYGKQV